MELMQMVNLRDFPFKNLALLPWGLVCHVMIPPGRSSPQIYFGEGNIEILRGVGLSTKSSGLVHLKC